MKKEITRVKDTSVYPLRLPRSLKSEVAVPESAGWHEHQSVRVFCCCRQSSCYDGDSAILSGPPDPRRLRSIRPNHEEARRCAASGRGRRIARNRQSTSGRSLSISSRHLPFALFHLRRRRPNTLRSPCSAQGRETEASAKRHRPCRTERQPNWLRFFESGCRDPRRPYQSGSFCKNALLARNRVRFGPALRPCAPRNPSQAVSRPSTPPPLKPDPPHITHVFSAKVIMCYTSRLSCAQLT